MPLRPDDEFVVIASDGIFDVFDNDQVRRVATHEARHPPWRRAARDNRTECKSAVRRLPSSSLTASLSLASPRQVVQIVRSAGSPQEAAALLTKSAFAAGSLDNLTAVVVALRGYNSDPQFVPSPLERGGLARGDGLRNSPLRLALQLLPPHGPCEVRRSSAPHDGFRDRLEVVAY